MPNKLFRLIIKDLKKRGGTSKTLAKGVNRVKKFIALFVSLIFAFSLGIAYAQEDDSMPWNRDAQTSTKKDNKTAKKAKKTNKKEARKTNAGKVKKTHMAKAEKTGMTKTAKKADTEKVQHAGKAKEEKKETGEKKKFWFW